MKTAGNSYQVSEVVLLVFSWYTPLPWVRTGPNNLRTLPRGPPEVGPASRGSWCDKTQLMTSQSVRKMITTIGWCFEQFSHLKSHLRESGMHPTLLGPFPQYPKGSGVVSRGSWCDERPRTTCKNCRKFGPTIEGCFIDFLMVDTIALDWTQHPWDFSQRSPRGQDQPPGVHAVIRHNWRPIKVSGKW